MNRRNQGLCALLVIVLLAAFAPSATAADGGRYRLQVNGISCPFCAYGIEKKLGGMEGVQKVEVQLDEGAVIVHTRPGTKFTEQSARKAVEAAGFGLQGFEVLAPAAGSAPETGKESR